MGVDLGIYKVAWSVWDGNKLLITGAYVSQYKLRQQQVYDVGKMVQQMVDGYGVDAVYVEETLIGNNRKYSIKLAQTMGAVLACLYRHDEVQLVNVSTWKKHVVGNGNATKDDIRAHITELGYAEVCGDDQDQYDAAAIGQYGVMDASGLIPVVSTRGTTRRRQAARKVS